MNGNVSLAERKQRRANSPTSLMAQIKGNLMANGNGTTKWVLVAVWLLTCALGGIVWEMIDDGIETNAVAATVASEKADANKENIDSLGYYVKELRLEQRVATKEQNIQLEQIAIATGAKVTIDTSTVVVDTVYVKDST